MLFTAQENAQIWNTSCEMDEVIAILKRYEKVTSFTDEQAVAQYRAFKAIKQAINAIDNLMLTCCEHNLP